MNHTCSPCSSATRRFFTVALLFIAIASALHAQSSDLPAAPVHDLGQFLNRDGTLKKGLEVNGSVDPRGWRMEIDAAGAPRFTREPRGETHARPLPPALGDENWDEGFGGFKMDGNVYAMALLGGDLYLGGQFDQLGESKVKRLARWDGIAWREVGGGVEGSVYALVADGTSLYVGGQFTRAGSVDARNIAVFSTSGGWSALGEGITADGFSFVSSLYRHGSDLYVGGSFTQAGTVSASNIARWNRTSGTWSSLGDGAENGINGEVLAIGVKDGEVYAGGSFSRAGSVAARNIARWNIASRSWSALEEGVNGVVNAIGIAKFGVYVGGAFDTAGVISAPGIARWSTKWRALGDLDGAVRQIVVVGGDIYIVGEFRILSDSLTFQGSANSIAIWGKDTSDEVLDIRYQYVPVYTMIGIGAPRGVNGYANAVAVDGDKVYLGGSFRTAGGEIRGRVVQYDLTAQRWRSFGFNVSGPVHAFAVRGNEIYVAGTFEPGVGGAISTIVKWDGQHWSVMEAGIDGNIFAMTAVGDELYVGGNFRRIAGVRYDNIASYHLVTKQWSRLGEGLRNFDSTDYAFVNAIAANGNDLYVGGYFTYTGDMILNQIGRWDRNTRAWSPMHNGVGGYVQSIVIGPSGLPYIGGGLAVGGDTSQFNLARWDGSRWSIVGGGVWGNVMALAFNGSDLYVGGNFKRVGGKTGGDSIAYLARWDGSAWHQVGAGIDGPSRSSVNTILVHDGDLYVGGWFDHAGGEVANRIARWDGSRWWSLGSGADDVIYALAGVGKGIYAGGRFITTGQKPAFYFGRWNIPTLSVDAAPDNSAGAALAQNTPNPFSGSTTISFLLARSGYTDLKIFDAHGIEVATLFSGYLPAGPHDLRWASDGIPSGVYYYRLRQGGEVMTRKLVVTR